MEGKKEGRDGGREGGNDREREERRDREREEGPSVLTSICPNSKVTALVMLSPFLSSAPGSQTSAEP